MAIDEDTQSLPFLPRPALDYPLETQPEIGAGTAVQIAPGVLWMRMPLFVNLPSINVFALEDGEGWTIVDTGIRSVPNTEAWQKAFTETLGGRPIVRVLPTHMHPDHCGAAGWLVEKFHAELWMSRLEYLMCRLMAAYTPRELPEDAIKFYRRAGLDETALDDYKTRFGQFGLAVHPLPISYRRIEAGERIEIGRYVWEVVGGSGHSPEHASLYCAELGLLISGDQVLPKISSNVSVHATEPEADPLDDWLTSLAAIREAIPDTVLVLPAHDNPFHGLHTRTTHLIAGHERCLDRLEQRLNEPKRAVDVFGALFARPIGREHILMAVGESLAHLNHLVSSGRATRFMGDDGAYRWVQS